MARKEMTEKEYNPQAIKCERTGEKTGRVHMDDGGHADFKCNYWPGNLKNDTPPPHKCKQLVIPKGLFKKGKRKPGKTTYVIRKGKLVEV